MKHRLIRVCEVIKRELSAIILREVSFPASTLVTISAVDITPDLKQAHVYISALGTQGEKRRVLEALEQNRTVLQAEMARRVVLKNTPHLNFRMDDSIERGTRVLNIIEELGLEEEKE